MIAGVDGCKDRWIAVVGLADGTTKIRGPERLCDLAQDAGLNLVVIDVPIGLVDEGPREADVQARKLLGRRGCCVFPAPIRPVLGCSSWQEACRVRLKIENKKMSQQQFGILNKVSEMDTQMRFGTAAAFHEGHPEVSFALMNGGLPISIGKKRPYGKTERHRLVCECFPDAQERMDEHQYHREDVLDAYALLWTARRVLAGKQRMFPEEPISDRFGLRMEIVA